MHRVAIAILLLCACGRGPNEFDRPSGPTAGNGGGSQTVGGGDVPSTDAGTQPASDAGNPPVTDAGARDVGDAGSPAVTDAGTRDAGDAGSPAVTDAGTSDPLDAGTLSETDAGTADAGSPRSRWSFSPVVGADAGPVSLIVTPRPGSSCAGWLPKKTEPELMPVQSDSREGWWYAPQSDGLGDLAVSLDDTWEEIGFIVDGHVTAPTRGGYLTPQPNGFLFLAYPEPCMICQARLVRWPGGSEVDLGRGIASSKNCSFVPRPVGGAYTSCVGPETDGGVPTFDRYDESLTLESSGPGDTMNLVAVDAQDRVLETDGSGRWRWLDSDGTAVSDFFPGSGWPQLLIGGGFLDKVGRVIPSGSASTTPAPTWLTERNTVSIAFGGRGYALGDEDCGLVLRDVRGTLCGTMDFVNCRTPPRPGLDGTIALPLNTDGYVTEQSLELWRGLLR